MTTANHLDPELGEMRRCAKCGESWPATREFFYRVLSRGRALRTWCRACESDQKRRNKE